MTRLIATGTMKQATAGSLRKHAQRVIADHPTMGLHTHLRDAARVLERGNTDGAIRHLNAAIGQLTPQSLQRHGVLTDEGHTAAKRHMDTIHRHLLLIKDIQDAQASNNRVHAAVAARNQADAEAVNQRRIERIRRLAAGDQPDQPAAQSQGGPPPSPAEGANVPVSKSQQAIPRAQLSSAGPGRPTGLSNVLTLSAQTARLAVTPAPRGRPGGSGLYDVKGNEHSPYLQQVVKALIEKRGMDPKKAYAVAWGALRKWRAGGGKVHPEVRAAASGALAQEDVARARAHAHTSWDEVLHAIELATVLDFFNPAGNPSQPRNPPGPGGGQFTGGQPQQQKGKQPPGKKPVKGKPSPATPGKPGGNQAQRAAQKKALLAKAATIRGQIKALQAMLTSSKKTAAKSPAAAAAAAKKAASTTAAAPPKKPASSTAAKKPGKKMTQAQIKSKIGALTQQLHQVLAQAAKL